MALAIFRPRRTNRPGVIPDASSLGCELAVNTADRRVWLTIDGDLIELRATGGDEEQARLVIALEAGITIRGQYQAGRPGSRLLRRLKAWLSPLTATS